MLGRCQDSDVNAKPTKVTLETAVTVKEIEEAVRECATGNCGRVRTIIGMARLREFGTYADVPHPRNPHKPTRVA